MILFSLLLVVLYFPLFVFLLWHTIGFFLSLRVVSKEPSFFLKSVKSRVAILYPTANDFQPSACETLLKQEKVSSDLFILDDSDQEIEQHRIDEWVAQRPEKIRVIRRTNRSGFKGGNINNWLQAFGSSGAYPFVLIVDADERLEPDFTYYLVNYLDQTKFAFVQAVHSGAAELQTWFQRLLHIQVDYEQSYLLPAYNIFGIPPTIGHGVLFRTDVLTNMGGFPNVVSEDIALTIALAKQGLKGTILTQVRGFEEFPKSYKSYWGRRRRWVQADTEVIRRLFSKLWQPVIPWLASLNFSLRITRLPFSSTYWFLLLALPIGQLFHFSGRELFTNSHISSLWWLSLLIFLLPMLPTLSMKETSRGFIERVFGLGGLVFVSAATSALHPVATLLGLLGYRDFQPTGSKYNRKNTTNSFLIFWELLSAALFTIGGILTANLPLVAIGIAVGLSPLMRLKFENALLNIGIVTFWLLIFTQIVLDFSRGYTTVSHLLPLLGMPI